MTDAGDKSGSGDFMRHGAVCRKQYVRAGGRNYGAQRDVWEKWRIALGDG